MTLSNLVDDLRYQRGQANSDLYEGYLSQETCELFDRPGLYPDGDGLYLLIQPNGEKEWVYHFVSAFIGMQHELELASYDDLNLIEAREKLAEMRIMVQEGFGDSPEFY